MKLRSRLRLPKEHGAWAMLYVPMLVGMLVAGSVSWGVVLFVLAATFLFIARESLLIWWRARTRGAARYDARRMMLIYLGLAGMFGAPLILVYRLFYLVPLGAVILLLLIFNTRQAVRREDRTTSGELVAILGLTSTSAAAHYVARGTLEATAFWLWSLAALYFASSIFYVKLRVYSLNQRKEQLRRETWRQCALYHGFLAVSLALLALTGSSNLFILAAFSPVLIRSFWHLARPANQLNLRRVGVLELIYSLVFLVFITLTFRLV